MRFEVNERLYLETVNETIADTLFELIELNREHLGKRMPWVEYHLTKAGTFNFIISSENSLLNKRGMSAGMFYQGILCGVIGLSNTDMMNKNTSMGYWISKEYQGKGIVINSCRALINHCFYTMGLHRVEIRCAIDNFRSQSIPKKLGFLQEGVLRQDEYLNGKFVDHCLFAMLEPEWKALNN